MRYLTKIFFLHKFKKKLNRTKKRTLPSRKTNWRTGATILSINNYYIVARVIDRIMQMIRQNQKPFTHFIYSFSRHSFVTYTLRFTTEQ